METIVRIRNPDECVRVEGYLSLACLTTTERQWTYLRVSSDTTVEAVLQFFRATCLGWPYSMRPALDWDEVFFKTLEDGEVVKMGRFESFPLTARLNEFVKAEKSVIAIELNIYVPSGFTPERDPKYLFPLEPSPEISTRIKQLYAEEILKQDQDSWGEFGVALLRRNSSPVKHDESERILDFSPRFKYYGGKYEKEPEQVRVKSDATVENVLQFFRRYCFRWPTTIRAWGAERSFPIEKKMEEIFPSEHVSLGIELLQAEGERSHPSCLAPYHSSREIELLYLVKSAVDLRINEPCECVIA